jgi:hypothetical protein
MVHPNLAALLKKGPKVINLGVEQFCLDVKAQDAEAVQVDWKPSAASSDLLAKLRRLKGGN